MRTEGDHRPFEQCDQHRTGPRSRSSGRVWGVLIIGVNNDEEVVGTDVSGMLDRISQVAATKMHPPLTPLVHDPIEGPDGKSVLLVSVAPSPVRPHMVDGAYWGGAPVTASESSATKKCAP